MVKIKSIEKIIEEIKEKSQKDTSDFLSGEEFEIWLKLRKQDYKE